MWDDRERRQQRSLNYPSKGQEKPQAIDQGEGNTLSLPKRTRRHQNETTILLCADGKGPLLEGEGNVLPCANECPEGFECELYSGPSKTGICCPNIDELIKLYNVEANQDARPEVLEAVESILESRDAAVEQAQSQEQLHPDRTALTWIQLSKTEIRQRQQESARRAVKAQLPKNETAQVSSSVESENFSCKRQQLSLYCEDGRRQTQFVLRWHHKEGACYSYPWGYCPGEPVASDPTLRTKEECELLCLDSITQQGSETDQNKKDVSSPTPSSSTSREFDSVESDDTNNSRLSSSPVMIGRQSSTEADVEPRNDRTSTSAELSQLENITRSELPLGRPLASSESSPISPPGIREETPMASNESSEQNRQEIRSGRFPDSRNLQPENDVASVERNTHGEVSLHTVEDRPSQPKKRCEKVSPYRAMCRENGMPSQFTLRYHLKGGVCTAYPYGYCHGESVYQEEPIKTEEECVEVCIQKGKN
ncbi:hypothetical protein DdX_04008 [Ditylenchus destructor]|uniref:BPTI/Kunitz inhibitor domain-containing protein n=1 Tax=Ditylenchus destructor TaxID=166010 RepID=A0AAD4NCT5_9BILA|nr:hypothetical protein DdX_04008 [Ditylenchus destructor]